MLEQPGVHDESPDEKVLNRRTAMKAALGGAAAAAVVAGPTVKNFSLAPDYAAAASCDLPNDFTDRYTSTGGSSTNYCWGGFVDNSTCRDGNFGPLPIGTLADTIQGTWSGSPFTGGGGTVTVSQAGTRTCTATATGICGTGAGTWIGNTGTITLTSTPQSISLGCSGSCTSCSPYGAKATLTVSCIC